MEMQGRWKLIWTLRDELDCEIEDNNVIIFNKADYIENRTSQNFNFGSLRNVCDFIYYNIG
jgi:hypothetical protein